MTSKNIILSLVLFLAIGISWLLVHNSFSTRLAANSNLPETPDGFLQEAHYVHFDKTGQIQSKVYSPKVVHYPKDDTSLLTSPQLEMHAADKNVWIITALHGISYNGIERVDAKDNVRVVRTSPSSAENMTLTTTALTAYPQRNFAETDQPVTIIQPGSVINSVGMTANLDTGDIKLLSQAQGVYTPTPTVTEGLKKDAKPVTSKK